MFLHIGNGKNIRKKKIIGIFDLDTATVSSHTKGYINKMQREGRLEYDDTDLPRSFVVYDADENTRVTLSRISTSGLKQRIDGGVTESVSN